MDVELNGNDGTYYGQMDCNMVRNRIYMGQESHDQDELRGEWGDPLMTKPSQHADSDELLEAREEGTAAASVPQWTSPYIKPMHLIADVDRQETDVDTLQSDGQDVDTMVQDLQHAEDQQDV